MKMKYEIGDRVLVPRDTHLPCISGVIERIDRFEGETTYFTPEQLDKYFVRHYDTSGGWYALREIKPH